MFFRPVSESGWPGGAWPPRAGGSRLPLGCVRSRRQGQARPPAAQLRGSSQYGITCTALSGATPCGWDDFTTDKTAAQLFYPCPDGS